MSKPSRPAFSRIKYKWQREIAGQYKAMTNVALLDAVISLSSGDDYDGEFSERGMWEFKFAKAMLLERLEKWLLEGSENV